MESTIHWRWFSLGRELPFAKWPTGHNVSICFSWVESPDGLEGFPLPLC
jgi:hypothetical protein